MRICAVELAAIAALLWFPAALAEGHFYAGARLGYAQVDGNADGGGGIEYAFAPFPEGPSIASAGIEGMSFDDGDAAPGILLGYQFSPYLSAELAATNLGSFDSEDVLTNPGSASLSIDEYALIGKLAYPITPRLAATWRLGVTQSTFSVDGEAEVAFLLLPFDVIYVDREPFSDPDSETGWLWGFGVDWSLSPRIAMELAYTKHENQLLEAESVGLTLVFHFRSAGQPRTVSP